MFPLSSCEPYFWFTDDGRTKPTPRKGHAESFEPVDNKCLVRASDGKKKISTVVSLLTVSPVAFCLIKYKLLMLTFCLFLFQVTTKEVIKFQMVCQASFATFNFSGILKLLPFAIALKSKLKHLLCRHTPISSELTWMDLRRKIRKAKARKPKPPNDRLTQ